jgi:Zn-dependent protease with chaperone function
MGSSRYNDGLSTAVRKVWLTLDMDSAHLVLRDEEAVTVDRWPFAEIRLTEKPVSGQPVRYRLADRDGPRLTSDPDSLTMLEPVCPDLRQAPPRERRALKVALWLGAAAASLVVLLIFVLPRFAHEVALVVPSALDQRIGDATERTILTWIGGGSAPPLCAGVAGRQAIDRLGRRLADAAGLAEVPRIEIVDSPIMNALALPGNRVLLLRGLIDAAPNGNALAGVLGHEFGHIVFRHPLEATIRQSTLSILIGVLAGDVYGGSALGGTALLLLNATYSRDAERDADQAALQTLAAANIDSNGFARFFRIVAKQQRQELGALPIFILSHPDPGDRAAMIRQHGHPGGLAMDAADWSAIKGMCGP